MQPEKLSWFGDKKVVRLAPAKAMGDDRIIRERLFFSAHFFVEGDLIATPAFGLIHGNIGPFNK